MVDALGFTKNQKLSFYYESFTEYQNGDSMPSGTTDLIESLLTSLKCCTDVWFDENINP